MPRGINENNNNVSPAEVQKYLGGMSYPATKDDLMDTAEESGAPSEVMELIEKMPDQDYGGPQDVMKAYGELKQEA